MGDKQVPGSLRNWFVLHFVLDLITAIPLLIAPVWILGLLGWESVDPISARIVAAALFGIGIESLLTRKAGVEVFRKMLSLKIIWSASAVVGIGLSLIQGARPWGAWVFLGIFFVFNVIWIYYKLRLK